MRNHMKLLEFLFAYKKGDKVHISHMVKTFERAYDEKWTREIFEIVQSFKHFGIRKYHLCDLDGEEVKGTFYEPELQLVDYSAQGSFEIETVIKKRGCGKKEVLVKWKGWPEKFNSWIPASDLQS